MEGSFPSSSKEDKELCVGKSFLIGNMTVNAVPPLGGV